MCSEIDLQKVLLDVSNCTFSEVMPRMTIQNNRMKFIGVGTIHQICNECFEINLTARIPPTNIIQFFREEYENINSYQPGRLLEENEVYSMKSDKWSSRQLNGLSISQEDDHCLIKAYSQHLIYKEKCISCDPIIMYYFPYKIQHPYNIINTKNQCGNTKDILSLCEMSINFEKLDFDNGLSIEIFSDNERTILKINASKCTNLENELNNIDNAVLNVFSFVVGKDLKWYTRIEQISDLKTVAIRPTKICPSSLYPPIHNYQHIRYRHAWESLFILLVNYLTCKKVDDEKKDLLALIYTMLSLFGEIRLFLVCVPPLIERMFKRSKTIEKTDKRALSDSILIIENIVEKTDIDEIHKKRIIGSIRSLQNAQEKSMGVILKELVDSNVLLPNAYDIWNKTRNKYLHGAPIFIQQQTVNEFHKLISLAYTIIFYKIGYKEIFTNYSDKDWSYYIWDEEQGKWVQDQHSVKNVRKTIEKYFAK